MLEGLLGRVNREVPQSLQKPIPELVALNYELLRAEGYTDFMDLSHVEEEYSTASITFSYVELSSISKDEFSNLQEELQRTVTKYYAKAEMAVPTQMSTHLLPEAQTNVLVHELQHLKILSKHITKDATVTVVFLTDSHGNEVIDGVINIDYSRASDKEWAISFSEPQSLSETDIERARYYAKQTGDEYFMKLIEQRISKRSIHL